jgi:hypothetical protein
MGKAQSNQSRHTETFVRVEYVFVLCLNGVSAWIFKHVNTGKVAL